MGWFGSLAKSVATEAAGAAAGAVAGNVTAGLRNSRTGSVNLSDNFSNLGSMKTQTDAPNKKFNDNNSMYGSTKKAKTSVERQDNIKFETEGDDPWKLTKEWNEFLKGNM